MDKKREIYVILIIIFTEILGFSLILPFLPYFASDLGATPLIVGVILASFSFTLTQQKAPSFRWGLNAGQKRCKEKSPKRITRNNCCKINEL